MFDKKPKNYTDLLGKTNRIVENTLIKGDVESTADFRLDGQLIGNFASNAKLVIGPSGSITGDIKVQNLDIEGKVEGTIKVDDLLNIKSTAIIKGNVYCEKLAVEPGALFTATCTMTSNLKPINQSKDQKEKLNG